MDFSQMLYNVMDFIRSTLFDPIENFISESVDYFNLNDKFNLSGFFGIQNIPAFSSFDLFMWAIAIGVSITALLMFIKFMKFLFGFIRSLFSGVKK